jgi:hypothetical protein
MIMEAIKGNNGVVPLSGTVILLIVVKICGRGSMSRLHKVELISKLFKLLFLGFLFLYGV